VAFLFFKRCTTQDDTFINQAIVADLSSLPHHHTHPMINEESLADFCTRMDFDSREPPAKMGNQTGSCKPSSLIESMGNTVEPDGMGPDSREKPPPRFSQQDLYL
jgi:hypothetical protein